ncbi:hypothetical protein [Amycolatopsis anabasis]|uniref:hypothetical protein n=1 Tax=Amycolatopsis anabasis TaxID=1840409 RepID=UPI00131A63E6|nr:hypothetical protein [Amycolatopsis anabasis]
MRIRGTAPVVWTVVGVVLLGGLGAFFTVQEGAARTGTPNSALLDARATAEVNGQIRRALERIFSYSYDRIEATDQAAKEVLAGAAVGEYEKLIGQVRAEAPGQKLVLSTKATLGGVRLLDGDRARLLVFLDQVATRADNDKTTSTPAAVTVQAERVDGVWKIVELIPR